LHIFKKMGRVGRSESTMCCAGQRACNPTGAQSSAQVTIVIKICWF
jgi:hypothetical protein